MSLIEINKFQYVCFEKNKYNIPYNCISFSNICIYEKYVILNNKGLICQYDPHTNKYKNIINEKDSNIRFIISKNYLMTISNFETNLYKIRIENEEIKLKK
jgi:hypothetical protein